MPENGEGQPPMPPSNPTPPTQGSQGSNSPVASRQMMELLLTSLEGNDGINSKLTEDHITKLIDQREKAMDYMKGDRKDERWDNKFYALIGVGVSLGILAITGVFAREYLTEVITAIISFLGGGGVGYGIGRR